MRSGEIMRGTPTLGTILLAASLSYGVSFSLDPWIIVLEPHKGKLTQTVTLKYVGDEIVNPKQPGKPTQGTMPIPVEISVLPRVVNDSGEVKYPSNNPADEFAVFPSQLILYPGDQQKIQLQWVADKLPAREITFGLIAAQLPVNIEDDQKKYTGAVGQLTILTRYEAIVVMRPAGVKPKIVVDSVGLRQDTAGKPQMFLVLSNQGTGMQSVKEMKLEVIPVGPEGKAEFGKKILYSPEMPHQQVRHAIFAGGKRRLILPWPEKIPPGPVKAVPHFQ